MRQKTVGEQIVSANQRCLPFRERTVVRENKLVLPHKVRDSAWLTEGTHRSLIFFDLYKNNEEYMNNEL